MLSWPHFRAPALVCLRCWGSRSLSAARRHEQVPRVGLSGAWGHPMGTVKLPGLGHLPWWHPSAGSAHLPGCRGPSARPVLLAFLRDCEPLEGTPGLAGAVWPWPRCTVRVGGPCAAAPQHQGSRTSARPRESPGSGSVSRRDECHFQAEASGARRVFAFFPLSPSLGMFQAVAVPSAHVPAQGRRQLGTEPPRIWEGMLPATAASADLCV